MTEPKTRIMPMSNPANYVARLEPFESRDEVKATTDAFFADLYALCQKHGIPDLAFIWAATVKDESKPLGVAAVLQQGDIGDPGNDLNLRLAALELTLARGDGPDEAHEAFVAEVSGAVEAAGVIAPCHFAWEFPRFRAMVRDLGPKIVASDEKAAEGEEVRS